MNQELIIVAEVLRPHGLRGEVRVRPLTEDLDVLLQAGRVYLGASDPRAVEVQSARMHKGFPLMKLAGVDDMNAAEALRGQHLHLPKDELRPLEDGEYFLHDLLGLTVLDHAGEEIGTTLRYQETKGPPLLVVRDPDGDEFSFPFADGTVQEVDLAAGTIRLRDIPGLVTLNRR